MKSKDTLNLGRESFQKQSWEDAHNQLSAADRETPLNIADLERLAVSSYLIGADKDSDYTWERAHQECLRSDDVVRAARCAFWLALNLRCVQGTNCCFVTIRSLNTSETSTLAAPSSQAPHWHLCIARQAPELIAPGTTKPSEPRRTSNLISSWNLECAPCCPHAGPFSNW